MTVLPVAAVVGLAVVAVVADYFVKRAGEPERVRWGFFAAGCALYAGSTFGWLYAMRHLKLATVGAVYSVVTVLLLTALGVLVFRESLSRWEAAGVVLGVASLVLLTRNSS